MAEAALTQQGVDRDGHQIQEGDESDHSDVDLRKGNSSLRPPVQVHPYMKNGLLIRRRGGTTPSNPGDVELDWITSTSTAAETGSQQQDLRLRKNNGSLNEVPLFQPLFGWNSHFCFQPRRSLGMISN